jgi:hypothetical protein
MQAARFGRPLWEEVGRLIECAPRVTDVVRHKLAPFAAERLSARGEPVPLEFESQAQSAWLSSAAAPVVLEQARRAYGGRLLLIKGPEIAALYPSPEARGFSDLDLLADDAGVAHAALVRAGFEPVGDPELYLDIHHLRPLVWGELPLPVEIHSRPKWLARLPSPSASELTARSVPSALGVDGVETVDPAAHALLVAAHSWSHEPLRCLRDLVDVAALAGMADEDELQVLARSWRVERLWMTTSRMLDAVFHGADPPLAGRIWAQNVLRVRERTVIESHLERWLSSFFALQFPDALRTLPQTFVAEFGPDRGEPWRAKQRRTVRALRNAARRRSEHDEELDAVGPRR